MNDREIKWRNDIQRALRERNARLKKKDKTHFGWKWKCRTCKYRVAANELFADGEWAEYDKALKAHGMKREKHEPLYACDYMSIMDCSCIAHGRDLRGDDPNDCELYMEGKRERKSKLKLADIPITERYDRDEHLYW